MPGGVLDNEIGKPLAAAAWAVPAAGVGPLPVQFGAGALGGTPPYTFSWAFGDGTTQTASKFPQTDYTYARPATPPATYTASVTVTDAAGGSVTAQCQVTVLAAPSLLAAWLQPDRDGSRSVRTDNRYRDTWTCFARPDMTAWDVLGSALLPPPGDPFRAWTWVPAAAGGYGGTYTAGAVLDPDAVVVLREPRRRPDAPDVWDVVVSYEGLEDPAAEPADVAYNEVPFQESRVQDLNGNLVCNSALDPFEGGMPADHDRGTLEISRNVPYDAWDPEHSETFRNSLNLFPFAHGRMKNTDGTPKTAPPGVAKISSLTATRAERVKAPNPKDARYYWRVKAVIEFDRRAFVRQPGSKPEMVRWRHVEVDRGYQQLLGGKKGKILGVAGAPSGPSLLDGAGKALPVVPDPPSPLPAPIDQDQAVIAEHDWYATSGNTVLTVPAPGVLANDRNATSVAIASSPVVASAGPGSGSGSGGGTGGGTAGPGSVSLASDGGFTYTPDPAFVGWVTFTYTASGPAGTSAPATVTILVGPAPRFRVFDRYKALDWSPVAQFVGGVVMARLDPDAPVRLTAGDVPRLAAAARFTERADRAAYNRVAGPSDPGPAAAEVWPLRVTGSKSGGYYPCRLQVLPDADPATGLPAVADVTADDEAYLLPYPGQTFKVDDFIGGILTGGRESGSPVFCAAGGSGHQAVRVIGDPDGCNVYPGLFQDLTVPDCGSGSGSGSGCCPTFDDGDECFVFPGPGISLPKGGPYGVILTAKKPYRNGLPLVAVGAGSGGGGGGGKQYYYRYTCSPTGGLIETLYYGVPS